MSDTTTMVTAKSSKVLHCVYIALITALVGGFALYDRGAQKQIGFAKAEAATSFEKIRELEDMNSVSKRVQLTRAIEAYCK